MKYVNLLGSHPNCASLRSFAKSLFDALEIGDGEERESGNYADGYYMKGSRDGIVFIVASSEESVHEDLPYWVHISSEAENLESVVDKLVCNKATPEGFRLAFMVNFGKRGERRFDY